MISNKLFSLLFHTKASVRVAQRGYRDGFINPYLASEVEVTPEEIKEQAEMPVWERFYNREKYMEHVGPLKVSSGVSDGKDLYWVSVFRCGSVS